MKMAREHRVPLSFEALDVLSQMRGPTQDEDDLIFPADGDKNRQIHADGLQALSVGATKI